MAVDESAKVEITSLDGGVSSAIYVIKIAGRTFVVKQALKNYVSAMIGGAIRSGTCMSRINGTRAKNPPWIGPAIAGIAIARWASSPWSIWMAPGLPGNRG